MSDIHHKWSYRIGFINKKFFLMIVFAKRVSHALSWLVVHSVMLSADCWSIPSCSQLICGPFHHALSWLVAHSIMITANWWSIPSGAQLIGGPFRRALSWLVAHSVRHSADWWPIPSGSQLIGGPFCFAGTDCGTVSHYTWQYIPLQLF